MADNNPQDFVVGAGGSYSIYVTSQELPHLDSPWTSVSINDKDYNFQRSNQISKPFSIAGYIQKSTMAATRTEAEGLNNALNSTPSGTFTDGFGTSYSCLVDSWSISPVAGINKWTVSMSLRIIL